MKHTTTGMKQLLYKNISKPVQVSCHNMTELQSLHKMSKQPVTLQSQSNKGVVIWPQESVMLATDELWVHYDLKLYYNFALTMVIYFLCVQ